MASSSSSQPRSSQQPQQQQQGYTDYKVKLAQPENKKFHVMRFKPPHKCDLEKLVNPTLDRQVKETAEEGEEVPESGEGSEYGRKWREEARKRKRGYGSRKHDPDETPWVLKEKKRNGAHFIGRKEGTVNASSSYFILTVGQDGAFEAYPIKNWYDFVPPVKYNYLNADEAEERFERRNKTLNYFSIMLSKKMKDQGEEGEEGKVAGEEKGGEDGAGSSNTISKRKKKQAETDAGLYLTDSSSGLSSDDSETETTSKKKGGAWKKKKKKRQASHGNDSEAGEETDEGEVESREVDYMSESSSDSENEFQAKQAIKEAPKDDEEVDRQEEGEIDKGFTESSSSDEEELTEEGKEIKALLNLQSSNKATNSDEEEEEEDYSMDYSSQEGKPSSSSSTPTSGSPAKKKTPSKSSKHGTKRDRDQGKGTDQSSSETASGASSSSKASADVGKGGAESQPPSKKQKTEFSLSTITEEEVKRYLLRRPITSKDLVKKFTSKKTEMDRNRVVDVLSRIINNLKDVEKQTIKGKMYLSLKKQVEH